MKIFTVDRDDNLKEFTDRTYPQGSFVLSRLLKQKDVRINGNKVSSDVPVKKGDEIAYYTTKAQEEREFFSVVYEDDNVLAVDKQDGVSSEGLFSHLQREKDEIYFIHRLDRNTKGLIVFAKNKESEKCLLSAFRENKVEKIYHALVCGVPKSGKVSMTAYLKKDEKKSLVKVFSSPVGGAVKITTDYKLLKSFSDVSLVEVTLHSGKTHQIRAHMAFAGYPVLGDEKYGNSAMNAKYKLRRQVLVAKKLRILCGGKLDYLKDRQFVSAFEADADNFLCE